MDLKLLISNKKVRYSGRVGIKTQIGAGWLCPKSKVKKENQEKRYYGYYLLGRSLVRYGLIFIGRWLCILLKISRKNIIEHPPMISVFI